MSLEEETNEDFDVNKLSEANIVEFLNKNCQSVDDAKYWLEFFTNRLTNLNVQNEDDSSSGLSLLRNMTEEARTDLVKVRELKKKRELLIRKISNIQLETEEFVDSLKEKCEELKKLEKQREQMVAVQEFKSILKKINDAYQESTPKAIMFYSEAVAVYQNLPKDCNQNLEEKIYAKIEEWETKLIETVKSDFLRTMSKLGWGGNEINALSSNQIKETEKEQLINQRNSLFLQLLGLQKPVKRNCLEESKNDLENVGEVLPPISALLIVFKKRFYFHFYGDRKTNNIEKPEWYLTQVLKWVQDSRDYLDEEFQPLVNKMWSKPVNVKVMFVDGLLCFVRTKMRQDLKQVVYNETLLSHYVDEVLNFDRELENSIDVENIDCCFYSPIQQLLLDESVFPKWIEMESNLVKEKLDLLLSDWENCWKPEVSDDPYLKFIPRSANVFLTLLDCISNRYQRLPSFQHRKQFFLVQLELLDEFRTRLMQLKNQEKVIPLNESFIGILNAAYYVTQVLTQWSSEVQYSTLALPNIDGVVNSSTIEIQGSVGPFDYQIETMNLFIQDCELILARYVANQIKEKVQLYRSQKFWSKSDPKKSQEQKEEPVSVSTVASDILHPFAAELEQLSTTLNETAFRNTWKSVCSFVDKVLYIDLALKTNFSRFGSCQLVNDLTQGLFPIFGQYTRAPRNFFPCLSDIVTLFSLSKGTYLLLKDHLEQVENGSCAANELELICNEYKLAGLTNASQILKVLSKLI